MTTGVRKRRHQIFLNPFAFDLFVASWSLTPRELPSAPLGMGCIQQRLPTPPKGRGCLKPGSSQ